VTRLDPIESAVAEAPPVSERPAALAARPKAAVRLELDGDELIQLSIKPSLWYIPLTSANILMLVAVLGVACALAMRAGATPVTVMPFQILACLAAVRIGVAMLQWASRLYVLTNRRVLRFEGVLKVSVAECRLKQIGGVDVRPSWLGRGIRLGSIHMRPADEDARAIVWADVARPQEIHELLVRAIRKAQS
jgi:hypothetical protein